MTTTPLLVLDVVGLTPKLLTHMPRLQELAKGGFQANLGTVLPAVTCSVQSTFLTGSLPSDHGIVGNGWYFRDLGEVFLWRQHNGLVEGEKIWETARRASPDYTVANLCWWYAMGATTDITVTPRPIYHADGRKSPDCYTVPASLHDDLTSRLGPFPLFNYWGPTAGIASSEWIGAAAAQVITHVGPDLTLVYLPHLDYDLQRYGPDGPEAIVAAQEVDRVAGDLIDVARSRDSDGRRPLRVRDHQRLPARRRQPAPPPGWFARRVHPGRDGVPRPVDVARLRRGGPPDRPRLRARPRRCVTGARRARRAARRGRGPRRGREGQVRSRPPAGGRARPRRLAPRVVHLLLLARRCPGSGLRPDRGDPSQARLRPCRAVHGPERPAM